MVDTFRQVTSEAARDEFYAANRRDLLLYALSLTDSSLDAEDAVADAVLRSLEHYLEHKEICPSGLDPVGWMKTIIRNKIIDNYRHARVVERHAPKLGPGVSADIAEQAVDHVMAEQFFRLTGLLKPQAQQIAILYWAEDFTYEEIAARLGIPVGTVRSTISRSRKRLRHKLGSIDPPSSPTSDAC
jgi:RNA polymerase sigma-70 factor, ECF subfamily